MNADELIARARSAMGKKIKYHLGSGGMNPKSSSPGNFNGECDCSGFVCWAIGLSRKTDHPIYQRVNGGWINTDAIVYDAKDRLAGYFELLMTARPGSLIVYPGSGKGVGHIGIVTAADKNGKPTKVIHCNASSFRKNGDSIGETTPEAFAKPNRIIAWYCGIEGGWK